MIIKRKYSPLSFPALRKINCRTHKLILLCLRFNNDMAVGVDDARPTDERPVIFHASFGRVNAEARVLVAPGLAGEAVVVEGFLLLPFGGALVLRSEGCGVVALL
jgi:hypothetical protein